MSKVDLSSFQNPEYSHGKSKLVRLLWILVGRLFLDTRIPYPMSFKRFILSSFGTKLGKDVVLKPNIRIKHPWFLEIGDHSWIGEGVWIDNLGKVCIKDNVCISQGAMLLCGNHDYTKSSFDLMVGAITLESGSWIGAQTVVCPGVITGENAVLSVGSIATKSLDANFIYQGNPAQKMKERKIDHKS